MRWTAWIFLLLATTFLFPARGDDFDPFSGPRPLVVLIQTNPWADVIGAETPRIVIYDNGDVIFTRDIGRGRKSIYSLAKLDTQDLWPIRDRLSTVARLPDVQEYYHPSLATDQSSARLYLDVDGKEVITSIYGLVPGDTDHREPATEFRKVPAALIDVYDYLGRLGFGDVRPWHPRYVEAMFWPDNRADAGTLPWPSSWPDLHSPRAIQRQEGWSIFLDASQEDALAQFVALRKNSESVILNGQRWTIAWRPVFPSEPVWRKAFARHLPE